VVLSEAVAAPPDTLLVANSPAKGTEPEATGGKG
jgi:hypothetical protein